MEGSARVAAVDVSRVLNYMDTNANEHLKHCERTLLTCTQWVVSEVGRCARFSESYNMRNQTVLPLKTEIELLCK